MTIPLEELEIYRIAEKIADAIWEISTGWDHLEERRLENNL